MGADCLWRGSSDPAEQACRGWAGGEGRGTVHSSTLTHGLGCWGYPAPQNSASPGSDQSAPAAGHCWPCGGAGGS